jgi:small subunit ribosomal protein S6
MFLFDSAVAQDWATIQQELGRLCDRIGAKLDVCVKFDERKLAYEIKRRKRGTYVLTYFQAPPDRIRDLERDAQLSELVLRVLVLRGEDVPQEKLAELKAWPSDVAFAPLGQDGRREDGRRDDGGRRFDDGGRRFDDGPRGRYEGHRRPQESGEEGIDSDDAE